MTTPLISILVPFKNTAPFLKEMIASVQSQSYEHWELIMVNDHSSDGGEKIVKDTAKNDQRILYLQATGSGIIEALRQGFAHSRGEFITRMDSDDGMSPLKLEHMLNQLLTYGRGHIALGQVAYFSSESLGNGYRAYAAWLNRLTAAGANFSEIYKECVIPSPCWMLYREDLEVCGAFNPNRYPEDYDLAFRMYEAGFKCIPSKVVLHYWRDYAERTSRTSPHYADNRFLDLKLSYFIKLDRKKHWALVLWGAGKKGKDMAYYLQAHNIKFTWITNNHKKHGHKIHGVTLKKVSALEEFKRAQVMVSVANKQQQSQIKKQLETLQNNGNYAAFFFC